MNTSNENIERLKFFQKQIKIVSEKYADKDLSPTERYTAIGEIQIISESLDNFNAGISVQYNDKSHVTIKKGLLSIIEDLKKLIYL